MNEQMIIDWGAQTALVTMKVAAPALLAIMLTGLVVSIIQAATQINEQTLAFIPKILAMTAALFITGPWIIQTMVFFTSEVFRALPEVTR